MVALEQSPLYPVMTDISLAFMESDSLGFLQFHFKSGTLLEMNPTSGSRITFNTLSPFLHLHLLSRTIKASISNIFPLILPNGNLISTLTFFFFLIDSTFTLMIHQKKIFSFLGDTSHLLLWTKKSFAMNKTDFSSSKSILRFPSKRRSLPYFCHPY